MAPHPFSLVPFPGESPPPGVAVAGSAGRSGGILSLRATLSGDLSGLSIPPPAPRRERRGRLWEDTCLELFLAEEGAPGYVELNLSPAGHWNAYRFDAPRAGMREEEALADLPFRAERAAGSLAFSLRLPLGPLFPAGRDLAAAVAAVVRPAGGVPSHWALAHTAPRPDFHRRDAFLLLLPSAPGAARRGGAPRGKRW